MAKKFNVIKTVTLLSVFSVKIQIIQFHFAWENDVLLDDGIFGNYGRNFWVRSRLFLGNENAMPFFSRFFHVWILYAVVQQNQRST